MTRKFGVSLDERVADDIERELGYGDSRSQRTQKLICIGLRVEDMINKYEFEADVESQKACEALVTEAFIELRNKRFDICNTKDNE